MGRPRKRCFVSSISLDQKTGCWNWVGKHTANGYGRMVFFGKKTLVHRVSAMLYLGLDRNSHLDVLHRCDNRKCFNPKHLFLGTDSENQLDSVAKGRQAQARKKCCPQGHPYASDNLYIDSTKRRHCRMCNKLLMRKFRAKKKASGLAPNHLDLDTLTKDLNELRA